MELAPGDREGRRGAGRQGSRAWETRTVGAALCSGGKSKEHVRSLSQPWTYVPSLLVTAWKDGPELLLWRGL